MGPNSLMSGLDSSAVATAAAVMGFLGDPANATFQSDSYNSDTSSNLGRDEDFDLDSESARSNSPNNSTIGGQSALESFDD